MAKGTAASKLDDDIPDRPSASGPASYVLALTKAQLEGFRASVLRRSLEAIRDGDYLAPGILGKCLADLEALERFEAGK